MRSPFPELGQGDDKNKIRAALGQPTPDRILQIAQALRHGASPELIHSACKYDHWFIDQIAEIVEIESRDPKPRGCRAMPTICARLKAMGFSDARLAELSATHEEKVARAASSSQRASRIQAHRYLRCRIRFADRRTCIPPMRPASGRGADEARPSARRKVIILGGGPNRIGQGIEFDYCCCHACFALHEAGYRNHHDQLQSRDRVDRLRHLRPALFRAADGRGCARDHSYRAIERRAPRRHRAVWRPDAAQACRAAGGGGRAKFSARRPTPSISPRTASGFRSS